jgi:hypothetical protein
VILSAHQPAYLPWLGYFEKIARVDLFVYLDSVQFEKNSYINRNRIKTPQGPQWLTIPIRMKGHTSATLRETMIEEAQPWRDKHLKSIEMNYRKAAFFEQNFPRLQTLFGHPEARLAELCWEQLQFWLSEFGIGTTVVRASELPVSSKKSDLVLDLCRHCGADRYLSGALGRDYLDVEAFADAGVAVEFQTFRHPVYSQRWGEFEPNLSVVDYWLNCGSDLIFNPAGEEDGI